MSADQIKIEVDVETREAIQALAKIVGTVKEAEKETKKLTLAQAAWKAANTDLGQLTAGWREVGEQVAKVGAVFAGLAVASTAAMAAQEREEAAIRRLGSAYDAVSAATNGAMSAQQALLLQGQLQAAGVRVNAQQMALMTRAVREYAQATGNDASEAIEKMTNAIVNNSEDALSELNLAQARASTSAQTLANVQRALEERFRGTSPAARTLNEDLSKLPQVITYIGNAAAQAAAGGLRSMIDALWGAGTASAAWRDAVNFADDQRTIDRQRQTDTQRAQLAERRSQVLARLNRAGVAIPESARAQLGYGLNNADDRELTAISRALATAQGGRGRGPMRADAADVSGRFDANFNLSREISEGTSQVGYAFTNALRENLGLMRRQIEDEGRKREPAVAANVRALDENKRKLGEFGESVAQAAASVARLKAGVEKPGLSVDAILEYYRGDEFRRQNAFEIDADRAQSSLAAVLGINATDGADFGAISDSVDGGGSAARAERSRRSRIANRDRETRRRARSESAGGQLGALFGVERDDNGNIKPLDGLQAGLSFAQQALPQLVSGFGELWSSIANGSATAGEAFAAFGAKALSTLGNVAIQEGSAMLFKAIPALIEAPPLGAAYLAGGAGLIALGMGLGAVGAAAAPKPATPSANSDANAARGMRSASLTSGGDRLGSTTVVLSSLVPTGVVDAVNARNGLRQIGRSGLDDGQRIPRRVEY